MRRRRKEEREELKQTVEDLDVKLEAIKAATVSLNRAAIAAGAAEKKLRRMIERAESVNATLRRTTQGR